MFRSLSGKVTLITALVMVLLAVLSILAIAAHLETLAIVDQLALRNGHYPGAADSFGRKLLGAVRETQQTVSSRTIADRGKAVEALQAAELAFEQLHSSDPQARYRDLFQRQAALFNGAREQLLATLGTVGGAGTTGEPEAASLEQLADDVRLLAAEVDAELARDEAAGWDLIRQQDAATLQWSLAGVLLAMAAVVYQALLVRRVVLRPIVGLSLAAQRVAQGHLDHAVPVGGADEIGRLQAAVNQMVANLKAQSDMLIRERDALQQELAERNQAQAELRRVNAELEARLAERSAAFGAQAELLDLACDAILVRDMQNTITFWNRGAETLYGWTKAEAINQRACALLHTELSQPRSEIEVALLRDGRWEGELVHTGRDGRQHIVAGRWALQRDTYGTPIAVIEIHSDITQYKQAQAALGHSQERFRAAAEGSVDGFFILESVRDADGQIVDFLFVDANTRGALLVGQPRDVLLGQKLLACLPGARGHIAFDKLVQVVATQTPLEEELMVDTLGVAVSWVQVQIVPLADGVAVSARDITAHKQLEAELRDTARQLRDALDAYSQVLDQSLDVICTTDQDGCFVRVSAASERLWGYRPDELIGRRYMELVHPDDRERTAAESMAIMEGRATKDFENRYLHKDGRVVPMMWSAKWSTADAIMYCVARDITVRKQEEEALQKARAEAEQANRAKSEFLSRMSHELRTPLNAILGFAQLLEMDTLTPEQSENVRDILKGGRHLLDLINEVLDIASIESGRVCFSPEPVPVAEVCGDVVALVQPLAAMSRIHLDASVPQSCDHYVLADRQRLKQVLLNLVSNGIKYNYLAGQVTLDCAVVPGQRLRLTVRDTGAGIPLELQAHLFEPFNRLGAEQTEVEGTGLGLALAKRLVEAMDGTIGVESVVGEGSAFWIELPLVDNPLERQAQHMVDDPIIEVTSNRRATVLYIEDNLSNLTLVERILAYRPGVQLLTTMQGRLGIELARQHRPDLILLDMHLPDLEGSQVLRRLRSDPATATIPVVIVSADATPRQVERLHASGASDYLTKPVDVRAFLGAIDTAVQG